MKLKHLGGIILISVLFNLSCTPYKTVPYFQDVRKDTILNETINNYTPLTLQPGDLLGISVTSLNSQADLMFNYNLAAQPGVALAKPDQTAVVGYLVDNNGNINFPLLGLIKVSGIATADVATQLQDKLQAYLSKAVVNVRILNFKISVLGDVKNPGTFSIQDEKITITGALSLAGDLNITGIRNNVMLIREKDGIREFIPVNLLSKSITNSSYYYLKNNDVLYVQPNKVKVSFDEATVAKVSLIISAISILILIIRKY